MNSLPAAPVSMRWLATLVLALGAAVLLLGPGHAQAKTTVSGNANFTLGTGKAGKALKKQGVKLKKVAPAKLKGKKLTAGVASVATGPVKVGLKGGFTFRKGKRAAAAKGLSVAASGKSISVNGKLAGKKVKLFKGTGKVNWTADGDTKVTIKKGSLKLTPAAAKTLKKKLKLKKKVPAAAYGKLALTATKSTPTPVDPCVADPNAEGCQPGLKDPYLAQCNLDATSKVTGNLAPAAPLPNMAGAKALTASPDLAWGFKASFRNYVQMFNGSLHALDGAGRDGAGAFDGFTFPFADGTYEANDPADTSDDQAVVNWTGTSVYCNTEHGFRIVISNPTAVIDGANSRLVADVDMNMSGEWIPAQRVDLAKLDLSGTAPFYNKSGSEVTWSGIPAELTAAGRQAFCRPAEGDLPEQCLYEEGEALDPVTVSANTEYPVGTDAAGQATLASYVKDELPFPLSNRTLGGCELPEATGGNTGAARTIDEWHYWNDQAATPAAPAYQWVGNGNPPAAQPDLTGGATVSGGSLSWGLRQGLRSSNYANGEFNLAGGVTASHDYYGVGGTLPATPYNQYNTALGGPAGFFTWPAADVAGTYKANGADRKLVLRTKGRVAICNTRYQAPFLMAYGTVLSNPTVVIDGANSRITVDVATRYRLSWVRGTVDIVKFDASDAVVNENTAGGSTTVEWALPAPTYTPAPGTGPVKLTKDGEAAINMLGAASYVEGTVMDSPTISATFPAGS